MISFGKKIIYLRSLNLDLVSFRCQQAYVLSSLNFRIVLKFVYVIHYPIQLVVDWQLIEETGQFYSKDWPFLWPLGSYSRDCPLIVKTGHFYSRDWPLS